LTRILANKRRKLALRPVCDSCARSPLIRNILLSMNPDYLWLTGAMQLLTLFVVGPVIAIAIAYAA
jgi:hypothetical protein